MLFLNGSGDFKHIWWKTLVDQKTMQEFLNLFQLGKLKNTIIFLISVFMSSLLIVSCFDYGEEVNLPIREDSQVVKIGMFLDSAVSGIQYESESQTGVTDTNGTFLYEEGELLVRFSVGGILLGEGIPKNIMTPVDLVSDSNTTANDTVINIARFLQTLDDDGNPDNGIQITEAVVQILEASNQTINFDLTTQEFEIDFAVLNVVSAVVQETGTSGLVSVAAALSHLNATIAEIDTESSFPPYIGVWKTACHFDERADDYVIDVIEISDDIFIKETTIYDESTCTRAKLRSKINFSYIVIIGSVTTTDTAEQVSEIDLVLNTWTVTSLDENITTIANEVEYCERTTWQTNQAFSIVGKTCGFNIIPSQGTRFFNIITEKKDVVPNILYLGDQTAGLLETERPDILEFSIQSTYLKE